MQIHRVDEVMSIFRFIGHFFGYKSTYAGEYRLKHKNLIMYILLLYHPLYVFKILNKNIVSIWLSQRWPINLKISLLVLQHITSCEHVDDHKRYMSRTVRTLRSHLQLTVYFLFVLFSFVSKGNDFTYIDS